MKRFSLLDKGIDISSRWVGIEINWKRLEIQVEHEVVSVNIIAVGNTFVESVVDLSRPIRIKVCQGMVKR